MAVTVNMPSVPLPVTLTVGDVTTEVGTLTLDPGETVQGALAELFRAAADALDRVPNDDQEVSPDGTA
ncbi:hypothetical protein [Streptomyces griseoloalbus]|uniref:Prophage tail gpP-like protein n=1 Tax=Streptomyces griseoloalbus TaxID=67303 RepID=A0A7W8BRU6_9ACTN|nr:hypothetical protein [Streptomyces albaduncus]MBB5128454.1 prophage tail gpP-like protein [Streptomyces albaduncus]GGW68003.1 hypothetical protein GCM10010340_52660 [Streptomyces albaduncus]